MKQVVLASIVSPGALLVGTVLEADSPVGR